MLILLPPSETKAVGGELPKLKAEKLSAPVVAVIDALIATCKDQEVARVALKLGPRQLDEVAKNLEILSAATMPAVFRYTGVVYDALSADERLDLVTLSQNRLFIQSSLFGLIDATTAIPYYRLSAGSKLPGFNLKKHWQLHQRELFAALPDGPILDMRSKAYQELATIPASRESYLVEVYVQYPDGSKKPLNHFNKKAKGVLARLVLGSEIDSVDQLAAVANSAGIKINISNQLVELVVQPGF